MAETARSPTLRLAVVGPWPPYRGGIAHFTVALARALRARGHHVEGLSFTRLYPGLLFPGERQVEAGTAAPDQESVDELIDSLNPTTWLRTASRARGMKPDAVIFQHWTPFLAPAYGTIARRLGARDGESPRRLAIVHNALPHERRAGDQVLSRFFLRALDGAVALSAQVAEDLATLAPRLRIEEGRHPVYVQFGAPADRQEARHRLDIPQTAPVLLFFGFVRRYKGLDVLLDAMPAILAAHPEAVLVVAGEFYDDVARYRSRISRLGIARAVRLEERYIPHEEVRLYFGAADVVVQPYRTATQSGVAQTAFGFGVPVVTTEVGGLAETVVSGETGLIVPPENPTALAAAVLEYLGDGDLQRRLRGGVRRERERPGWVDLARMVEGLMAADPQGLS